jgi:hypothetical protein
MLGMPRKPNGVGRKASGVRINFVTGLNAILNNDLRITKFMVNKPPYDVAVNSYPAAIGVWQSTSLE